ncbi:hypothetical protein D3C81_1624400 [compost metagenome]
MIDHNSPGVVQRLKASFGLRGHFARMIDMRHDINTLVYGGEFPDQIQQLRIFINAHGIKNGDFRAEADDFHMFNGSQLFEYSTQLPRSQDQAITAGQ